MADDLEDLDGPHHIVSVSGTWLLPFSESLPLLLVDDDLVSIPWSLSFRAV